MANLYYIDRHWHGSLQVDIGLYGPFFDGLEADDAARKGTATSKGDFSLRTRRVEGVCTDQQAILLGLETARLMVMGGQTRAECIAEIDRRRRSLMGELYGMSGRALKLMEHNDAAYVMAGNPSITVEEYNRMARAEWPPAGMTDWMRHDV